MADKIDFNKFVKQSDAEASTKVNNSDSNYADLIRSSYKQSRFLTPSQSLDTYVDYGVPIYENVNLDDQLAENQSAGEQLGKGALRLGASTALKAAQGFSMLGSAAGELAFGWAVDGSVDFEDIVDNPVNNMFFGAEDYIKNQLAIYKPGDWQDKSIWQQLGSTAWWADEFADGLAFALSTIVPSAGIGKLGLGLKATQGLTKAGLFKTALSELDDVGKLVKGAESGLLSNPVKFASGVDKAAQYGLMTSMEALQEARDTREQVRQEFAQRYGYDSYDSLPEDIKSEANLRAAEAGKNTFWWNMVALAPSNLFEIGLINKFLGGATSATKGAINLGENIGDVATRTARKGFSKFANDTMGGSILKTVGKSMVAEGLYEENIQHSIQEISKRYGAEGRLQSMVAQLPEMLGSLVTNLGDKEAQKSIVSGMLIGGLMGGVSTAKSYKKEREYTDKLIGRLNEASDNFLKTKNLYEYEEIENQDGTKSKKLKLDEEGNPIIDKRVLAEFAANRKAVAELKGLEEDYENDEDIVNLIKNEQLSKYVAAHMEAGLGEEMLIKLKSLQQTKDEDLQSLGFSAFEVKDGKKEDFATKAQQVYNRAERLKKDYETYSKFIPGEEGERLKEALRTKARVDYLSETRSKLENQIAERKLRLGVDDIVVQRLDDKLRQIRSLEQGIKVMNNYDENTLNKYKNLINNIKRDYVSDYTNNFEYLKEKGFNPKFIDLEELNYLSPQSNSAEMLELESIQNRLADTDIARDEQLNRLSKLTDYIDGKNYFENGLKASIYRKKPLQLADIKEGDILRMSLSDEDFTAEVGRNENGVLSIREGEEMIELTQEFLDSSIAKIYTREMRAIDIRRKQLDEKIVKRKADLFKLEQDTLGFQEELNKVIKDIEALDNKISVEKVKGLLGKRNELEKKKKQLEDSIAEAEERAFELSEEIIALKEQAKIDNSVDPLKSREVLLEAELDRVESGLADSKDMLRRIKEVLASFDSVVEFIIDNLPVQVQPTFLSLYKKLTESNLLSEDELKGLAESNNNQTEDGDVNLIRELSLSKQKEIQARIKELNKAKVELNKQLSDVRAELAQFDKLLETYDLPFNRVEEIEEEELDTKDIKGKYSEVKAKKFFEKNKEKQVKLSYLNKDNELKQYTGYLVPTETGYKLITIVNAIPETEEDAKIKDEITKLENEHKAALKKDSDIYKKKFSSYKTKASKDRLTKSYNTNKALLERTHKKALKKLTDKLTKQPKPLEFTSEKISELVNNNAGQLRATRYAAPKIFSSKKDNSDNNEGGKERQPLKRYITSILGTAGKYTITPDEDTITSDIDQQRWFQYTESYDPNDLDTVLRAFHKDSKDKPKGLPFYDDDTIMVVPYKNGSPVLLDGDIVFSSIPKNRTVEEAKEQYTTMIGGKQLTDEEIQTELNKLSNLREVIFNSEKGYDLQITGKSTGVRNYMGKNEDGKTQTQAVENILDDEDINELNVFVPMKTLISVGLTSYNIDERKKQKPFIMYKGLLIETMVRNFGSQEADDIIDLIIEFSRLAGVYNEKKAKIGEVKVRNTQFYKKQYSPLKEYLKDLINFGASPSDYDYGINFKGGKLQFNNSTAKGKKLFELSESILRENKMSDAQRKVLKQFLMEKRHQIDSNKLKENKPYTEYELDSDGKLNVKRKWKTYKEYLLSSEGRETYEIPLTVNIEKDEDGFIAKGIYLNFHKPGSYKKEEAKEATRERKVRKNKANDLRFFAAHLEKNMVDEQGNQYEITLGDDEDLIRIVVQLGSKESDSRVLKQVKILDADNNIIDSTEIYSDLTLAINYLITPSTRAKGLKDEYEEILNNAQEALINISPYVEQSETREEKSRAKRQTRKANAKTKSNTSTGKANKDGDSKDSSSETVKSEVAEITDELEEIYRLRAKRNAARLKISEEEAYQLIVNETKAKANKPGKNKLAVKITDYQKEELQKAKEWFTARFPNVNFDIVNGLILGKAWGRVEEASRILISDVAEVGTTFHEAFHYVTQFFLTDTQRAELYNEWRTANNSQLNDFEVEEILAEQFRDYMLADGRMELQPKTKNLFQRLWSFLKGLFIKPKYSIKELFENINKGEFRGAKLLNTQVKEGFNREASKFDSPVLRNKIMNEMTSYLFSSLFSEEYSGTIANLVKGGAELNVDDLYKLLIKPVYLELKLNGSEIGEYVIDNWSDILEAHSEYLEQFGLKLAYKTIEELDEELAFDETEVEVRNKSEYQEVYLTSSKNDIPLYVKLLIAGLPKVKWVNGKKGGKVIEEVINDYGFLEVNDYDKTLTMLGQTLAGAYNHKQMVSRLESIVDRHPEVTILLERMRLTKGGLTNDMSVDDVKLVSQFFRHFAKADNTFYITLIDGNKIYQIDANSQRVADRVRERWKNNLRDLVRDDDSLVTIVNGIIQLDIKKFNDFTKTTRGLDGKIEVLNKIGINFNHFDKFTKEEVNVAFSETYDWIINSIRESKGVISDIFNKKDNNSQNRLNLLINLETKYSNDVYELQHINPEGKTVYSLMFNNNLSLMVNKLKEEGALEHHANNLFVKNSYVLKNLAKHRPELRIIEGLVSTEIDENNITSNLTSPDYIANYFSNVMKGVYPFMRASDKKTDFGLDMGLFIDSKKVGEQFRTDSYFNIMLGYLKDEIETSRELNINGLGSDIKHYNKNARNLRMFDYLDLADLQDVLNNPDVTVDEFINKNKAKIKKQILDNFKELVNDNIKLLIDNKVIRLRKDKYTMDGISHEIAKNFSGASNNLSLDQLTNLVSWFTGNLMIANTEQFKLFIGDPAFYKSIEDIFKRTSALTSPRRLALTGQDVDTWLNNNLPRPDKSSDGIINVAVVQDVKVISEFKDKWNRILRERGSKDPNRVTDSYESINEADGQGIISLPEYRELQFRFGAWEDEHEIAYQKVINNERLTEEEMFLFQPLKPQGFGAINEIDKLFAPSFYKLSLYPIYPQLVENTQLAKVYEKMIGNGIGALVFESGVKSGILGENGVAQPLYKLVNKTEQEGDINNEDFLKRDTSKDEYVYEIDLSEDLITQGISYEHFGIQVDISPEDVYEQTVGSQQQKLVMLNLKVNGKYKDLTVGNRTITKNEDNTYTETVTSEVVNSEKLVSEYHRVTKAIVDKEFDKLIDSLGVIRQEDGSYLISDWSKIREKLVTEAKSRQLPDNIIVGIDEMMESENKFFDILINRKKIESLLVSFVNNRVVKRKTYGQSRVQVATTGFEKERVAIFDKKKGHIMRSGDLKAYDVYDDSGITKHMQVKTALPKKLISYVESIGGLNRFNEMIKEGRVDPRILRMVGFRIPTQGHNSMVVVQVVEFLPYQSGNVIVLPSEITTIAGSDFDIDKLNLYFANFKIKGTELNYVEYGNKEITDRYLTYLRESATKDTKDYIGFLKSNEYDKLAKDKLEKYQLKGELKEAKEIIYQYGLEFFRTEFSDNLRKHYIEYEQLFREDGLSGTSKIAAYVAVSKEVLSKGSYTYIGKNNGKEVRYTSDLSATDRANVEKMLDIYADELLLQGVSQESVNTILSKEVNSEFTNDLDRYYKLENSLNEAYNTIKTREISLLSELTPNALKLSDFINLPVEQQYSTKELQNRLIELNELILTAKENFENLITPNFEDNRLKKLAGEIRQIHQVDSKSYNKAINLPHINKTAKSFWQGKGLLGIVAKANVHHVLSQLAELNISSSDVEIRFKGVKQVDGRYRLDNEFTTNGDLISEVLSEFINAFVDVAKDPYVFDISATKSTINTVIYLLRLGVDIDTIVYFINQPIIRDYVSALETNNSIFRESKDLKSEKYKIVANIRKSYVSNIKDTKLKELLTNTRKGILRMNNETVKRNLLERFDKLKVDFTKNDLKSMLDINNAPSDFYIKQVQVLDDFLEYDKQAQKLTNLTIATSHDTVGMGKNLNNAQLIEEDVETALTDTFFDGVDRMFNEDNLLSIYRNVVNDAMSIYKKMFLTKRPEIANIINDVKLPYTQIFGFTRANLVSLMDRLTDDIFTWILHTTKYNDSFKLESQFKRLLMGENSIAHRVKDLYESEKDLFDRGHITELNPLLTELYPMISADTEFVNVVRLFSKMMNTYENNMLVDAFNDLFDIEPELANDLVKASVLQSGLDNSFISFASIVPNNKYVDIARSVVNEYIDGDIDLTNMVDDIFRNSWWDNNLVQSHPYMTSYYEDGVKQYNVNIQGGHRGHVLNVEATNPKSRLPYLKVYTYSTDYTEDQIRKMTKDERASLPKVVRLFKNTFDMSNNNVIFKEVNKKGAGRLAKEFNKDYTMYSKIKSNNITDVEFDSGSIVNTENSSEEYNLYKKLAIKKGKTDYLDLSEFDSLTDKEKQALIYEIENC